MKSSGRSKLQKTKISDEDLAQKLILFAAWKKYVVFPKFSRALTLFIYLIQVLKSN